MAKYRSAEAELTAALVKADAEHEANCARARDSANKRAALARKLAELRAAGVPDAASEQVEIETENSE